MPTLHELFDAATDGMPPLPDLAPSARRIVRRRQLATRTSAAVLASALVIGAGTFALSVHPGNAGDAAGNPPQAFSLQYELETLQSIWPNKNQQLSLQPGGGSSILISEHGRAISYMHLHVLADISRFPEELGCTTAAVDCVQATTPDGDKVLAQDGDFSTQEVTITATPSHWVGQSSAGSSLNVPTAPGKKIALPAGGEQLAYRLHGTYLGQLELASNDGPNFPLTDQQLLAVVESPAYEQLVESAIASSSLDWFGTPPAGIPSDTTTYVPSPSDSGN